MEQDDIFKLLLILLLITNERENCPDQTGSTGQFSTLNELIIVFLLFGAFSCPGQSQSTDATQIPFRNTSF